MVKNIVFIGGGLKGGGQERSLSSLANYFAGEGHRVSIINLFKTEQFFEINSKIEVFWPGISRVKYNRIIYAGLIVPYLRSTIRKIHPDVILSYGEWFNPYVILATRLMGIPLFVFDRMGPGINLGPVVGPARTLLYRYAEGIIVQTSYAQNLLSSKTKTKNITVIPNPVNVIETDTSAKEKRVVTVGRLAKEKGHIHLIRAFAALAHNDWTLHVIGDGPEKQNLEQEAVMAGISERVIFYGHLKKFEEILGRSSIFVLPSLSEGFPNALIEAMSVPLACISSNCIAGPGDIIKEGVNGLLVEPANESELTAAMNTLIENTEMRNQIASEAFKIRETLAFEKIARKYSDFIFNKT
jgi:GalNAc-alpha-(1->4)-GalNAc-alpha-(1->3)-diNAcBac-PP-undecaprenol alpha-1,4-N-acetyl-D-galactosaminyltransferase